MALVIERRQDESLTIGDDIRITVSVIKAGKVKLVIDAPGRDVKRDNIKRPRPRKEA
jgi:carbon storage regulator CsrA